MKSRFEKLENEIYDLYSLIRENEVSILFLQLQSEKDNKEKLRILRRLAASGYTLKLEEHVLENGIIYTLYRGFGDEKKPIYVLNLSSSKGGYKCIK